MTKKVIENDIKSLTTQNDCRKFANSLRAT